MFFAINNATFGSYADDNTILSTILETVIIVLQCFSDNQMKSNSDKCYFITITNKIHQILVGNSSIGSRIKIDSELMIMLKIRKKANEELKALAKATQ